MLYVGNLEKVYCGVLDVIVVLGTGVARRSFLATGSRAKVMETSIDAMHSYSVYS